MTDALRELQAAVADCATYADAYWVLGWVQADLGDQEAACLSFNRFLGLLPDDQRSEQAKAAIERLGGTVTPQQPGEATAGAAAGTEDQEFTEQPALTPEQANALIDEAAQALVDGQFETAIVKCLLAEPVLADDAGLHRLLSLSYGAAGKWGKAFGHAETAVQSDPSESLRLYQILAALAQADNRVPAGYNGALQMDSRLLSTEHYTQESLAEWHKWNQSLLIAEDGNGAAPQLIGRAISRFRMYYDNPEDYPVMMQLGHNDLRTALRAPCPDHLLPENNEWTSKLVGIDFLRPQTETEMGGYEKGLSWLLQVRIGGIGQQEMDELMQNALADYAEPGDRMEYQTGTALARHDEIWVFTLAGDAIEQLISVPALSAQSMGNHIGPLMRSDDSSQHVIQLADFLALTQDESQPIYWACKRLQVEAGGESVETSGGAGEENRSAPRRPAAGTSPSTQIAYLHIAQDMVRSCLKSPASAQFSNILPIRLSDRDGLVHIHGSVDSANPMGVMMRNTWSVAMTVQGVPMNVIVGSEVYLMNGQVPLF